ncbi:MAG: hypothetical protein TREMPRED_003951 [Tremellales sp. Tagirdzhanova-0007]|nr:MAG: hypothetical protein TREMPRED_003951 [Tremellales sp. Tagirdzhanova-0007]
MSAPRLLSLEPQRVLIDKINGYATRGTLLTAPQVRAFAQAICGEHVGINGVGCFVERHKDVTPPTFFAYQEAARLKANTPKTRRAFYSLSGWINCFMIKKWLETVFDAYTRELFPVVDFLEASWARNISCLILPVTQDTVDEESTDRPLQRA